MPKLNKNFVETAKTVTIAVLITAIAAFIGGMKYQASNNATVQKAVAQATSVKN